MSARPGLCGGQSAMVVPTAINNNQQAERPGQAVADKIALECDIS